jgi:hypothetical protein
MVITAVTTVAGTTSSPLRSAEEVDLELQGSGEEMAEVEAAVMAVVVVEEEMVGVVVVDVR